MALKRNVAYRGYLGESKKNYSKSIAKKIYNGEKVDNLIQTKTHKLCTKIKTHCPECGFKLKPLLRPVPPITTGMICRNKKCKGKKVYSFDELEISEDKKTFNKNKYKHEPIPSHFYQTNMKCSQCQNKLVYDPIKGMYYCLTCKLYN